MKTCLGKVNFKFNTEKWDLEGSQGLYKAMFGSSAEF